MEMLHTVMGKCLLEYLTGREPVLVNLPILDRSFYQSRTGHRHIAVRYSSIHLPGYVGIISPYVAD